MGEALDKAINIRLPKSISDKLEIIKKLEGKSGSEIIRELISDYVESNSSVTTDIQKHHHYIECGLSYVYLENGFLTEVVDGDNYISFHQVYNLHKVIGLDIINQKRSMTGEQLRFIRDNLQSKYNTTNISRLLGVDINSLYKWENNSLGPVSPLVDVVMRILYAEQIKEDTNPIGCMLKNILESSGQKNIMVMKLNGSQWEKVNSV